LPGRTRLDGDQLLVSDRSVFTWVLEAPTREAPSAASVAWMAWQVWRGQPVQVTQEGAEWRVVPLPATALPVLPDDWMADCIERIALASMTRALT
jgi:hypothetical protein